MAQASDSVVVLQQTHDWCVYYSWPQSVLEEQLTHWFLSRWQRPSLVLCSLWEVTVRLVKFSESVGYTDKDAPSCSLTCTQTSQHKTLLDHSRHANSWCIFICGLRALILEPLWSEICEIDTEVISAPKTKTTIASNYQIILSKYSIKYDQKNVKI